MPTLPQGSLSVDGQETVSAPVHVGSSWTLINRSRLASYSRNALAQPLLIRYLGVLYADERNETASFTCSALGGTNRDNPLATSILNLLAGLETKCAPSPQMPDEAVSGIALDILG